MAVHQKISFHLDISSEKLQRYYKGSINSVSVIADDGRRIQFPVSSLRPFISHAGVKGNFVMSVDANYKLIDIHRKPA